MLITLGLILSSGILFFMSTMVVFVLAMSVPTSHNSNMNEEAQIEIDEVLNFEIVKKEILKKGGQMTPLIRPNYTLIKVFVVLKNNKDVAQKKVKNTLNKVISLIRQSDNPDAISVYLHESTEHIKGGTLPLAHAEWWPKGHSLSPDNSTNIKNKNTHVIEYTITLPEKVESSKVVTRLPETDRREIFTALVKSQDKAQSEADAKYNTDSSKIPFNQLKSYDFKTAITKNADESDYLMKKYRIGLLKKYKITEEELQKISTEAFIENWPMPSF